jgi:hypothetical protein
MCEMCGLLFLIYVGNKELVTPKMIESLRNELITLRTEGLVNAMQSMKDIEALFDKVTSNYRPLLNGERLCCS